MTIPMRCSIFCCLLAAVAAFSAGCRSPRVDVEAVDGVKFPPREEPVRIVWKKDAAKVDKTDWLRLGDVVRDSTRCNRTKALVDEELHDTMRRAAADIGGDVLVLDCGAFGSYRECKCNGRVYLTPEGGQVTEAQPAPRCIAGTTQPCFGPGGCQGAQSCRQDGMGFERCICPANPE